MHFIAISWLIYELTKSSLSIAILVALTTLPSLITFPFSGVFADRYNKKIILIAMDIIRGLLVLSIPILHSFGNLSIIYLYLVTVLLTMGGNFFYPALIGLVKDVVPEEKVSKVISANSTTLQLGIILGSGLAGFIISNFSIYIIFYIDAATFLISALLLLPIKIKSYILDVNKYNESLNWYEDFKEGLNYVKNKKILIYLFIIGLFPGAMAQVINSLLNDYTVRTLSLGVKAYGFLDAIYAVGAVTIGVILTLSNKVYSPTKVIPNSFLLMSISFLILTFANNLIFASLGLFLLGIAILPESVSRKSLLIKLVDGKYIGRVESMNWTLYSLTAPTFAIIAGVLSNSLGNRLIFLSLSLILICVFIFSFVILSRENVVESKEREQLIN